MGEHHPPVHSFTSLWEYECCGDPVEVGGTLTVDHRPWRAAAGGIDAFAGVLHLDWYVGHHTVAEEPDAGRTRVRVLGLWEAGRELDYHPYGGLHGRGEYRSVAGSARLTPIPRMATLRPEWEDGELDPRRRHTPRQPFGWVMRLQILDR